MKKTFLISIIPILLLLLAAMPSHTPYFNFLKSERIGFGDVLWFNNSNVYRSSDTLFVNQSGISDADGDTRVTADSNSIDPDSVKFWADGVLIGAFSRFDLAARRVKSFDTSDELIIGSSHDKMKFFPHNGGVVLGSLTTATDDAQLYLVSPGNSKAVFKAQLSDNSNMGVPQWIIEDSDSISYMEINTTNDDEEVRIGNDFTPAVIYHLKGNDLDTVSIGINVNAGTGASITIDTLLSSDMAGKLTLNTGTSLSSGAWFTVSFDNPFEAEPIVTIQPANTNAAELVGLHYVQATTTSFSVYALSGATGVSFESKAYELDYVVVGGK